MLLHKGKLVAFALATLLAHCLAVAVSAADWPQWRGPNRYAKATQFTAPKTWPKELKQKWKATVGDGVATPTGEYQGVGERRLEACVVWVRIRLSLIDRDRVLVALGIG